MMSEENYYKMKTNRINFMSLKMGEKRKRPEERRGEGRKNNDFLPAQTENGCGVK